MNKFIAGRTGKFINVIRKEIPFLTLKEGHIVKARVLYVKGSSVSLKVRNRVFEAKTEVPLRLNERLLLKVEKRDDTIRLRVVNGGSGNVQSIQKKILSFLEVIDSEKLNLKELTALQSFIKNSIIDTVQERIPAASLLKGFFAGFEEISGSLLKDTLNSSGILFETKLKHLLLRYTHDGTLDNLQVEELVRGDLKGVLLRLREVIKDPVIEKSLAERGIKPGDLLAAVDKFIKNIEHYQLHSRPDESLQGFLPFLWNELRDADIVFRDQGGGSNSEKALCCLVKLDIESIGNVHVWVFMQSNLFHLRFITESSTFLKRLRDSSEALNEQFKAAGLKLGSLEIDYEEGLKDKRTDYNGLNLRI